MFLKRDFRTNILITGTYLARIKGGNDPHNKINNYFRIIDYMLQNVKIQWLNYELYQDTV